VTRRVLVVCAVLVLAVPCLAGNDREFDALVKTIETQYGVRHTRIPLLGFATFCLRVAGTPGAAGLKIAVFNDALNSNTVSADAFEQSVATAIGNGWHPLVRARSRDDGSVTMIYTNPDAKELQVLVVTLGGNDATIVQTKLKTSQIWKWIREPQDAVDRNDDPSDVSGHVHVTIAAN
jgi:hypothetical protein